MSIIFDKLWLMNFRKWKMSENIDMMLDHIDEVVYSVL